MDPSVFAAVGAALIGLIGGAAGCLRGIHRARPGAERRHILLWSAAFTLALSAFLAGVCLVPRHAMWLFGAPMLAIVVLAVYAVRRVRAEPLSWPTDLNKNDDSATA
jgi:uncharacterized membrane protein